MITSATTELLPAILSRYTVDYPEVRLNIAGDLTTPQYIERLLDGRSDVGVIRGPLDVNEGLTIELPRQEPIGLLLSADHPRAEHLEIEMSDLRNDWFVSLPATLPAIIYSAGR
ncbi:LysR substrate-binding domain-containing protein [Mycolicibacterium sp. YH-1]|uniref:LysR substrate-binding domain-containing protein n=1 Tax=Mycolicibacterium sp. YH-1 TaxID=2908837 RepID=UPI00352BFE3A